MSKRVDSFITRFCHDSNKSACYDPNPNSTNPNLLLFLRRVIVSCPKLSSQPISYKFIGLASVSKLTRLLSQYSYVVINSLTLIHQTISYSLVRKNKIPLNDYTVPTWNAMLFTIYTFYNMNYS